MIKSEPQILSTFWSKVTELENGCWEWQGERNEKGYGRIAYKGKRTMAHRVAWEFGNTQKIPEGMLICHKCDNPPCVNPEHLFIGTHQSNADDMFSKERQRKVDTVYKTTDRKAYVTRAVSFDASDKLHVEVLNHYERQGFSRTVRQLLIQNYNMNMCGD